MRERRGKGRGKERETEHEMNNNESGPSFLDIWSSKTILLYYFLDFTEDKTLPKNRGYSIK